MASERGERRRLDADAWRRIGAVLDRVSDLDVRVQPDALEEACQAEGVRLEHVRPYIEAHYRSDSFPGRLDATMLGDALHAFAADAGSARLAPGTRLGPYEILSLVGVGGMGEVYKARDTRLNRTVALKRLTAHMAASQEGRKRFEREAHATSTLNHPHICTLHDVGTHEGVEFLVMEFSEGETLAARLQRGALSMTDALQCAAQMAEALAAAHRQGIVHRDLKPANVMLTEHGVKLLDFGLAALRPPLAPFEGGRDDTSTVMGTILGTLQYMSPEQIQGKPIDGRTDIFAVGAILYEMLTGRKAFDADSSAGVVAAVLEHTPQPLTADRPDVPPELGWTVAQCLTKAAEERWQSAADLARQLRWYLNTFAEVKSSGEPRRTASARSMVAAITAAIVLPLVIAFGAAWKAKADVQGLYARYRALEVETANYRATIDALLGQMESQPPTGPDAATRPTGSTGSARLEPVVGTPVMGGDPAPPAPPLPVAAVESSPLAEVAPAPPAAVGGGPDADSAAVGREAFMETLARLGQARDVAAAVDAPTLAGQSYRAAIALELEAQELATAGRMNEALVRAVEADARFRAAEIEARAEAAAWERLSLADAAASPLPPSLAETRGVTVDPSAAGEAPQPVRAASQPVADVEGVILDVIAQYVSGLENRSLAALKRVWPSLGGSQERAIQTEFENARTVQTVFSDPQITINGDTTTVTGLRKHSLVTQDDQRLFSVTRTTMTLRRSGDAWVIEGVVHQQ